MPNFFGIDYKCESNAFDENEFLDFPYYVHTVWKLVFFYHLDFWEFYKFKNWNFNNFEDFEL